MPKSIGKLQSCAWAICSLVTILPDATLPAAALIPSADENGQIGHFGGNTWSVSSNQSDQIQAKVVVTKRRRHGNYMDANFRIEFTSVPLGKEYTQCLWDMGMKLSGAKPSCFKPGSVWPDENGKMATNFELTDFAQGEWVQVTIRSMDGAVHKSARFIPFK